MSQPEPLRHLPVDLSELDFLASFRADEMKDPILGYLDTQTGDVHSVSRAALACAEEEGDPDDLEPEAQNELDLAIRIAADGAGRHVQVEAWESRDEYRLMERFAEATQTDRLRNELLQALAGPRPFRRFKDVLESWTVARAAWFAFEEREHRQALRDWLNSLGIDPVDTSPRPSPPVPERW
jgi:Uncharacterised protein family (UPF0158)